jgi:uncharacterized LabA/DUF88 family protein
MKTAVYVDGFNLYYGSLKGTGNRWLDLCAYFERTLPTECDLVAVKYFTARVASLPHNPDAPKRQDVYLRALRAQSRGRITIIEGQFKIKEMRLPLSSNHRQMVDVLRFEEKGSDVNLAVELVNDAWENSFDCAAVVSNDADLERAMRIVKQRQRKRVLLYTPGAPKRKPLAALARWAHKQINVLEADLAASQLPRSVNGLIHRPGRW